MGKGCRFTMEGKIRQKGEQLIITKSGRGLVFKRKAKVRNKRQKFLKVGQKFRSRRNRQEKGVP